MNCRERQAADAKKSKLDLNARGANDSPAVYDVIIAEMRAGRHLEAKIRCRQALEISPEHPELLHLMALACFNVRQFDDAVQWASSAIRKDPRPTYLTTLGSALLNLRRRDDAVKVFDKAVQLKPHDADLWSNFGDALVETECAEDAILCFRRAFEIDPNCWNSAYKAGALLREQNRLAEALASFDA
jgi:tetratricopeptide (TPR) repeat protein